MQKETSAKRIIFTILKSNWINNMNQVIIIYLIFKIGLKLKVASVSYTQQDLCM